MKITRISGITAALAAGALVLSACGSDNTSTSSSAETSAGSSASAAASGGGAVTTSSGAAVGGTGDTTFDGAGFACAEGELRSSGSTAQGKVVEQWIADYNGLCNANINAYGGGGSGKGIQDFIGNQVDFAGSDFALKEEQTTQATSQRCAGNVPFNLPMVTGPIALAFNVSGVDELVLTPDVLGGIFSGSIANWNAPEIAALNSGATLPDLAIQAVHRAEDSGTTENFTKYLAASAPTAWTAEPSKSWSAPGGVAAQGSDGVAKQVASTDGSIGYVEWGFAVDDGLNVAQIDNGGGPVELTAESAGAAVAAAEVVGTDGDLTMELDYATQEPGAYPVILVTYEIVCSAGNGEKTELLKSFLGYMATDGQAGLEDLGAAPLPAEIQTQVIESVSSIS